MPLSSKARIGKIRSALRERFPLAETFSLSLYCGLLAWAIPFHEPWADEAQAWQIARTLSLPQMFRALSYEGHPALWYLLLWVLSRSHISYAGMHWVAGSIATAGVAVLLFASPFPRFVKVFLPFTFYLSFQYAIVARSYVMVPLLLFLCAYWWRERFEKPLRIALCLGLLANVTLHAAVISGGLAGIYLIDLWLSIHRNIFRARPANIVAAGGLLAVLYAAAIGTAFPAKDASGGGLVFRPNVTASAQLSAQQSQLPILLRAEPTNRKTLDWLEWKLEARLSGGLTQGVTGSFWVGCLFWATIAWKCFRARRLHYLIPPTLFVIFCSYVYAWFWHSGMMLVCIITMLWMTWPSSDNSFGKLPAYERVPVLMLFLIALVQIGWAEYAFRFDHMRPYAPGVATAAFLQPYVASQARIVEIGDDFLSVDLLPYFDRNVFLNEPYPYYWWSIQNPAKSRYQQLLLERPAVVVLEWQFSKPDPPADEISSISLVKQLGRLGYQKTRIFCGGLVKPGRQFSEWDCNLIYQPLWK